MTVGEACNREVIVIGPDGDVPEAVRLMREYHVGDVVVVQDREGLAVPVGILTDRDIVIEVLAEQVALESVAVRDIMSAELLVLNEHEELMEGLKRMREAGVRRAPVIDRRGALVGILSVDDVLELIAEQLGDLVKLITREQRRERAFKSKP